MEKNHSKNFNSKKGLFDRCYDFCLMVDLDGVDRLQSNGDHIPYYFKMQCMKCGAETPDEVAVKYDVLDHKTPMGTWCNMKYKCRLCECIGWINMVKEGCTSAFEAEPGDQPACLMGIRSKGFNLFAPSLNGGFTAMKGSVTAEINLANGNVIGEFPDGTDFTVENIQFLLRLREPPRRGRVPANLRVV